MFYLFFSVVSFEGVVFHVDKTYYSFKLVWLSIWKLDRDRFVRKSIFDTFDTHCKISTDFVDLIYETHTRYMVFVALSPYCLSLRLYSIRRRENRYSSIQYSHRSFYFDREVYVTWSIDDIDTVTFPETSSSSRSNSNTSLLFLSHPIHRRSTFMYFTDLVVFTCIKKNTFCSRSFTSINMCNNTYISHLV